MTAMRVLITDQHYPDLAIETALLDAAGVAHIATASKTEDEVIRDARDCDALIIQYAPITARVLDALPRLGIVSRYGAGYDTIDTEACAARGVWVANSPDYGVGEVATHALALALTVLRGTAFYDRDIKRGTWNYLSNGERHRVGDMTLGILGLGRIGKRMAHVSRNVFKRVIACDPYLIDGDFPAYVERVTFEELLAQSDVLSLHVPLTAETRGLVNAAALAKAKRGLVLVNTARGAVVDTNALYLALESGAVSMAGLDVLPNEPISRDDPLLTHARVVLTPHAAFYSVDAEREMRRKAVQNVITWFKTGKPDYIVVRGTRSYRPAS